MNKITSFWNELKEAFHLEFRGIKLLQKYYPGYFPSVILYDILQTLTPYINVYLSAQIISEITGYKQADVLWKWVLITLVVNSLLGLAKYAAERWCNYWQVTAFWYGNEKIFADKLQSMDFSIIDRQETYELLAKIKQSRFLGSWGITRVGGFLEGGIMLLFSIIGTSFLCWELFATPVPESAGALTILNHPIFTFGIIFVLLLTTILSPVFSTKGDKVFSSHVKDGRVGNLIFSFYGYKCTEENRALDMRMYNQQDICKHYIVDVDDYGPNSEYYKLCKGPIGLYHSTATCVSKFFTGFVYFYVCLKAWSGAFDVGAVTQYIGAFIALSTYLSNALREIGYALNNAPFLKTTFEFLDTPNEMYQGSLTTEKRSDRQYEVEFRNVSFKYPGSETYALRNVSMKFRVGSRLAVVGMNGSGKTTFIKLLCRLYDPTEGEILLNGINIQKYKYEDYISIFSVVFQDFQLLSLPLGQNVAASVNYDADRVLDCLKKAGFEEKLAEMPQGLETYLNKDFKEDGVNVSGGEAQKIAIARALYKDAPFIVLDEPTAALDPIAEAEIYSKFNEIAGDKTAIYISHRLSSCRFCDDILVFHEGGVIQQGRHESLVADTAGKYYELWNAQAQYYV